jgi:hypothetical protein
MGWLSKLAERVLAHAMLDQLLRYNGFVISGIAAADQARGVGRRLIYLRPETWATNQKRHRAGPGAPVGPMQSTHAEQQTSAPRGSGGRRLGGGPLAEATRRPSEDGGEGCHAVAGGQGASCQVLNMSAAQPEVVASMAALLQGACGGRCDVGEPLTVRNEIELNFPFRTPTGHPGAKCDVKVSCHVCFYDGCVCIKPEGPRASLGRGAAMVCAQDDDSFCSHEAGQLQHGKSSHCNFCPT